MFLDELTFRILNSRGGNVRWPSTMDRYRQKHTVITVSPSFMVWGCLSGLKGRSSLYFLPKDEMMNGCRYITVWKNTFSY